MEEQVIIKPSSRNQIVQDTIGAVFAASIVSLILYFNSSLLLLSIGPGCGFGLAGFLFSRRRYNSHSPIEIAADNNGMSVVPRSGPPVIVRWGEVKKAFHSTLIGGKWTFHLENRIVTIHDDGIGFDEWSEFSRILCTNLLKLGVPVAVDPIHNLTTSPIESWHHGDEETCNDGGVSR
jgi:hypothetical protein